VKLQQKLNICEFSVQHMQLLPGL